MSITKIISATLFCFVAVFSFSAVSKAQAKPKVLEGEELKRIVPGSFYFAGQSAETQMRNSVAGKLAENRYVISGLVDTSGYSTEISGKYEGFLITDSPVKIGNKTLKTGAYGFGFSTDRINVFDLSSKQILSVSTKLDTELKRPRPLMMIADEKGIRLYKGKSFVLIVAR